MCGLAQALNAETGGQELDAVSLLSIGTGVNPKFLDAYSEEWGLAQWAPHLIGIMFSAPAGLADFQCRQILGERYHRLDAILPEPIGLDAVDRVSDLEAIAERVDIAPTLAWLHSEFAAS